MTDTAVHNIATTPSPSEPPTTPKAGKNRFSLNAMRIPFVSSPRRDSAQSTAAVTSDSPEKESSTAASVSDSPTKDSATPIGSTPSDKAKDGQLAPPPELKKKRSSLSPNSADAASRRAMSPHRVSFSPSTEEMADAREQALSLAAALEHESPNKLADAQSSKSKPRAKLNNKPKWRGFKSHSTSDLTDSTRRISIDSVTTISSTGTSSSIERFEDRAALPGAAAAKRRLFRWDRKGINKSQAAKVKVTKHEAQAQRHAKTLEQVINAGMGLHPVPLRASSAVESSAKNNKVPQAKPIPMVGRNQLKGLKSALLDVNSANKIIEELRRMQVPVDGSRSGVGTKTPEAAIGTAGEHGQERILATNLPDSALQGPISKDDSEIRKRAETTERPVMERKAKSAAEEALRKITAQADAPLKAIVTARTSSLPPTAEADQAASTSPSAKNAAAQPAVRPLKMVCLDSNELDAHRRHAEHLEAASVNLDGEATEAKIESSSPTKTGFNVTSIATGAAAAIAGVGGIIAARSTASPAAPSAQTEEASGRPPMLKSMSATALPTLQSGQALLGSAPLQLLLDPVGTAAANSGAFETLAAVSGTAIRASQDMSSIHPPLDRMAIFVHWWGFEITLPKASMAYLGTAHSISGAFLSFLQTMAMGGGVPELLPFIKYISTFMEVEYKAIQAQDRGNGVCIAGTWFMPLALVPRPWDYPLDGPVGEKASMFPAMSEEVLPMPAMEDNVTPKNKKHMIKKKKKELIAAGADGKIAQVAVLSKDGLA